MDTEEKTGKWACVELAAQTRVKHIIGAQLKKPERLYVPQTPKVSSVKCHPEKKAMLKKSAEFHVHVYKLADIQDLLQHFL